MAPIDQFSNFFFGQYHVLRFYEPLKMVLELIMPIFSEKITLFQNKSLKIH
jgi:hypothetical protein